MTRAPPPRTCRLLGVRNGVSVPLVVEKRDYENRVQERTIVGVLHVFNKKFDGQFLDEDVRLLQRMAMMAAAVISSAQMYREAIQEKQELIHTIDSLMAGLLMVGSNAARMLQINPSARAILKINPNIPPFDRRARTIAPIATGRARAATSGRGRAHVREPRKCADEIHSDPPSGCDRSSDRVPTGAALAPTRRMSASFRCNAPPCVTAMGRPCRRRRHLQRHHRDPQCGAHFEGRLPFERCRTSCERRSRASRASSRRLLGRYGGLLRRRFSAELGLRNNRHRMRPADPSDQGPPQHITDRAGAAMQINWENVDRYRVDRTQDRRDSIASCQGA